jgi:hypothetical protein
MRLSPGPCLAALLLLALAALAHAAEGPAPLLARIKSVGAEGAGNASAQSAWRDLVRLGPKALFPTLAAMKDASPIARNWLRAAADTIAEKALAARQLSSPDLEAFVRDRQKDGAARRIAYEWLVRLDATAPQRLLPGMLDDPGSELRRDAVARLLEQVEARKKTGDKAVLEDARKALDAAADPDQVEAAAKLLKGLGAPADLATHYGAIRRWMLLVPFDNTGRTGYERAYLPEKKIDLGQSYKGKKGAEARWQEHVTEEPRGLIDLNEVLGKQKGVVAYAYAVVESPKEQVVQFRAGCVTALKIFLNGKPVLAREEYHHGMRIDQYIAPATLRKGRNEILVKVCQNEQTESWAQNWKFQVRLSDALGRAVPFRVLDLSNDTRKGGQPK